MSATFPKWTNKVVPLIILSVPAVILTIIYCINTYATDANLAVGYQPVQPIDFPHPLHAGKGEGQLGLDCRYCHVNVEKSPAASVPPSQVCMNCHQHVKRDSAKLKPLFDRHTAKIEEGGQQVDNPLYMEPIPWVRVHKLPDYVYFDHSVHVNANVGCASCHGRIDEMQTVRQDQPLTMRWCLDCHDNPEMHIRPEGISVTQMDWGTTEETKILQEKHSHHVEGLIKEHKLNPPRYCSACHR